MSAPKHFIVVTYGDKPEKPVKTKAQKETDGAIRSVLLAMSWRFLD